jgi:hypothetical protein
MFGTPLIHPEGKTVTKQEEGNDAQSDKAGDALLLALTAIRARWSIETVAYLFCFLFVLL